MLHAPRLCHRFQWMINRSSCNHCWCGFTTAVVDTKLPLTPDSPVPEASTVSTTEASPATYISPLKKSPKKPKNRGLKSQQLLDYISHNAGLFAPSALDLPTKSLKVSSSIPTSVYLIDETVTSEIAEVIKSQNLDLDAPAIELNPGVGILTSQLIKLGFKNLTCFEEHPKLATFIKEKFNVPVIQKNFVDLPRLHHVDKVDGGTRVANLLNQVKVGNPTSSKSQDRKKKNLHVFGAIPHLSVINFLIKSLVTQKILYEDDWGWDDPIYYVALGSRAYWILTSSPASGFFSYRPSSITFQLLFKTTVFRKVSRKGFIPWMTDEPTDGRSQRFKLQNNFDPELMYFIKIETNHEVIEKLGKDNLLQFWYFVRQHLFSRKNSIIPELEQWIPGCGARLIRQGFTIYSQFGELTPKEILDIYLQFISWPEFPGSSFLNAVEKFQTRMEPQDEDVMEFHKVH